MLPSGKVNQNDIDLLTLCDDPAEVCALIKSAHSELRAGSEREEAEESAADNLKRATEKRGP
jgi:hypothetical protein